MNRFKKRTIALVLASVISVAGSFASENFKNSLMSLDFQMGEGGNVKMVLETKRAFQGNINPVRKDANTYVLMLPEINSEATNPDLTNVSSNIQSVNVRTMPYTNNGNGYTRITIKTYSPINLSTEAKLFVPSQEYKMLAEKKAQEEQEKQRQLEARRAEQERLAREQAIREAEAQRQRQEELERQKAEAQKSQQSQPQTSPNTTNVNKVKEVKQESFQQDHSFETMLLVFGILVIIATAVLLYIKAKDKLRSIAGESLEIDTTEDEKKSKPKEKKKDNKKNNKIKEVKKVKQYSSTTKPSNSEYTVTQPQPQPEPQEELNIVDLDELFQEQKNSKSADDKEEEENQALEDFLSGFSFDEEYAQQEASAEEEQEEEIGYDEEYYEKLINNEVRFSQSDVERMNKLLNNEIDDSTLRNIDEYAVSNPIVHTETKEEALERLVTDYTISQNITFTSEDVEALYKLINVEIDNDFITDLRTNPELTKQMYKDLSEKKEQKKRNSEILTLKVKDSLPDLTEALKKQGGKRIESQVKPITVYYSEGYEVSKLSVTDSLPDLTEALKRQDSYASKPSASYEYVDESYTVEKFTQTDDLPDLKDVLANPDKYKKEEPEEIVVDADALLNNILNVQFKPFDDGSRDFEVLNDFSNEPEEDDVIELKSIPKEELENIMQENIAEKSEQNYSDNNDDTVLNEIVQSETSNKEEIFEELIKEDKTVHKEPEIELITLKPEAKKVVEKPVSTSASANLIQKIQEKNEIKKQASQKETVVNKQEPTTKETTTQNNTMLLGSESYTVLSSTAFDSHKGCHLAKNSNGYTVLAYIDEKFWKIKDFESLKSEKIQSRLSDKSADGSCKYILRIGTVKFIVRTNGNNIEYLMDL